MHKIGCRINLVDNITINNDRFRRCEKCSRRELEGKRQLWSDCKKGMEIQSGLMGISNGMGDPVAMWIDEVFGDKGTKERLVEIHCCWQVICYGEAAQAFGTGYFIGSNAVSVWNR